MDARQVKVHFRLVQDRDGYPPVAVESVWAQRLATPDEYEIENVPFFSGEAALGDVVAVRVEGGVLWFDHVLRRSGNSLIRISFFDRTCVDRISRELAGLGCSTEFLQTHSLLAVNVPKSIDLQQVQAYLQRETDAGRIDYEEPIL